MEAGWNASQRLRLAHAVNKRWPFTYVVQPLLREMPALSILDRSVQSPCLTVCIQAGENFLALLLVVAPLGQLLVDHHWMTDYIVRCPRENGSGSGPTVGYQLPMEG
ncbi:hypothetical protein MRX96_013159 [Rhipicephalus microplus]